MMTLSPLSIPHGLTGWSREEVDVTNYPSTGQVVKIPGTITYTIDISHQDAEFLLSTDENKLSSFFRLKLLLVEAAHESLRLNKSICLDFSNWRDSNCPQYAQYSAKAVGKMKDGTFFRIDLSLEIDKDSFNIPCTVESIRDNRTLEIYFNGVLSI